jgi:two-component system, NtrC family, sensor kinase
MKNECPPLSPEIALPLREPARTEIAAAVGRELFHSLQDPVLLVDTSSRILAVNGALLRTAGKKKEDVVGRGVCEIIHGGRWPHISCPLEDFLKTCSAKIENTRLPGLGGQFSLTVVPIEEQLDGEEPQLLLIARKLTSDEVREVDSIRTAQLAALGELAAGVAHEINNPINGIINFAQLLADDFPDRPEAILLLDRIISEGDRIARIIYNLLSFARENGNSFALVDLNEVIKDSLSLVEHQCRKDGIAIEASYHEPSCLISGNFSQLQQVVLNLISNSRYALKERYRGSSPTKKIEISCQPVVIDGRRYYQLMVKDYGTGIPQGILDKMFEPFFTSKPPAQGSGLGLSISYGIIANHKGILRVDSLINSHTAMIAEIPSLEQEGL